MDEDAATDDGNGMCFPFDVLLDIFRRLPCRSIAQSRSICLSWRRIVDKHSLLLHSFFSPRVFPGVFTNHFGCRDKSYFLAPPASRSSGTGDFQRPLFWHGWARVKDHCNGLLLLYDENLGYGNEVETDTYVCNPATIRCTPLPRPPTIWPNRRRTEGTFLAFDPAVSLHYEVYKVLKISTLVPRSVEAKPKLVDLLVFSSQTGEWERREFIPGRFAPEHLHSVGTRAQDMKWPAAEYWRGSLYVGCENGMLMILHCSERTYDMVQLPGELYKSAGSIYDLARRSLLASYERGVQYAALNKLRLQVWALTELCDGQPGWTLTHEANLGPHVHMMENKNLLMTQPRLEWDMLRSSRAPASLFKPSNDESLNDTDDGLDDTNSFRNEDVQEQDTEGDDYDDETYQEKVQESVDGDGDDDNGSHKNEEKEEEEEYSWNSDEDNFIEVDKSATDLANQERSYCGIIGLHPYKDVILLDIGGTSVAYHLATSRIQYLCYGLFCEITQHACGIEDGAFPYRPCYVDALPAAKIPCPPSVLEYWKRAHCSYGFMEFVKSS